MTTQPKPTPNDGPTIVNLVIDDLRERDRIGHAKYGTSLQAFNGRDALRDMYDEDWTACSTDGRHLSSGTR
jgi:hypothetical protein